MEFKIGDIVKIIENTGNTEFSYCIGMCGMIQEIHERCLNSPLIYIKGIPYTWEIEELELIKRETL